MKKFTIILFFIISISALKSYAQIKYIVTAENGLILREKPNSKGEKLGKLPFGAQVQIIEETAYTQTIQDDAKEIKGTWVKVKIENKSYFISNEEFGYVFDGYLKKKSTTIKNLAAEVFKQKELENYTFRAEMEPFYLRGDFFGDKTDDLIVLLKNDAEETKIAFIDYGKTIRVYILGLENDPFNITDYSWVGIFEKVDRGEALWSNFEDDFIDYKDVPENKKVKLNYNAIYMHASESCGGGFVYWQDGKFNWLQQE
ncbi:SH3 domain-containing protein [Winogradskyella undariae]|uniref:SH3 domain-containing protein n=1 Tax=Winogradskyella undariae TaxID=1285465 RepID=UPI00156BB90F|nr:SH3 domain-containing protein [Winogradskyella undariae]NRR92429.1 SH3 domain-containing protein [Winogradskyella undariae]